MNSMKKSDIFFMALENLKNRKSRTKLTVIGVVIGTCAIVIMVSIGVGINNMVTSQFSTSSANQITVMQSMSPVDDTVKDEGQTPPPLDDDAVEYISKLNHVKAVVPIYNISQNVKITRGQYSFSGYNVTGVDFDKFEQLGIKVVDGDSQITSKNNTIYFGDRANIAFVDRQGNSVKYKIDQNNEIQDCEIDLMKDSFYINTVVNNTENQAPATSTNSQKLRVGGIVKSESAAGIDVSNSAFIDIDTAKKYINEYNKLNKGQKISTDYSEIYVYVDDINNIKAVQEKLTAVGLQSYSDQDSLEYTKKIMMVVQLVLGAIGAVSMFVAAFGISNTMVMAVYERTKEIGVMKVIGCSISDIKALFLYEAGIIGFLGGAIGVIISWVVSLLANFVATMVVSNMGAAEELQVTVSSVPLWLALLGVGFATLIGIISGASPASRAVKVSALKAIHNE